MPRAVVTEAFTWIGTALAMGVALGASVSGKVVDVAGANAAFLVATAAAAGAGVVVAAVPAAARGARRARRGPGAGPLREICTKPVWLVAPGCRVWCPLPVTYSLELHRRSAVDLLRVASALCPGC